MLALGEAQTIPGRRPGEPLYVLIGASYDYFCNLLVGSATYLGDNRKGVLMKHGKVAFLLCSILTLFLLPTSSKAQDFHKTYSLGAGAQIRIRNISGDVKISGYSGSIVEVIAHKEGRDRDAIQIEENSKSDRLELGVRYPEKSRNTDVSVNFVVRVPQSIHYVLDISSVSGNVQLTDVTGQIKSESVSGNVHVQNIVGIVNAHTVSGEVNVEIRQLQGAGDLNISSVSGGVHVKAPQDLDADVKMSSVSGAIKTDFPIQVRTPRYGPGQSASAQLGSGSRRIHLSSVSGGISLNQKQR
jgi:hypothetical protein